MLGIEPALRGSTSNSIADKLKSPAVRRAAIGAAVFLALSLVLALDLIPQTIHIEEGQVADRDIEAPRTIVNRIATEALQKAARDKAMGEAAESPEFYRINEAAAIRAEEKIASLFAAVQAAREKLVAANRDIDPASAIPLSRVRGAADDLRDAIAEEFGLALTRDQAAALISASPRDFDGYRNVAQDVTGKIMRETRITRDNLEEVRDKARTMIKEAGVSAPIASALSAIIEPLVEPNLVFDIAKAERYAEERAQEVEPERIVKGQIILRRKDVATAEDIAILRELGLLDTRFNWPGVLGVVLLSFGLVAGIGVYVVRFNRKVFESTSLLGLVGLLVTVYAMIAEAASRIPSEVAGYLIPLAFVTMITALLVDHGVAMAVNMVLALLTGVLTDGNFKLVVVLFAGGVAGLAAVTRLADTTNVSRAGFIVGAVQALVIVAMGLGFGDPEVTNKWYLGIINGIASTVLTIGSLPFLESVFKIASSLRFLELANPNQPLLKRLLLEAPGTYHHSILVGNLAEAAAEAVGADPLVVRVGALYHDIGKVTYPDHFTENQIMQDNPHDKYNPALSTLIITRHVKDGVELANSARLPEAIVDIIRQHHGTTMVAYFYAKAVEAAGDQSKVNPDDFRYPGPKPQTKEAALVMLADAVEASVRALPNPTQGRIEGHIRKIIKEKLDDGQLDECDLTLRDLGEIAKAFSKVLNGMSHKRIEYPESIGNEM